MGCILSSSCFIEIVCVGCFGAGVEFRQRVVGNVVKCALLDGLSGRSGFADPVCHGLAEKSEPFCFCCSMKDRGGGFIGVEAGGLLGFCWDDRVFY